VPSPVWEYVAIPEGSSSAAPGDQARAENREQMTEVAALSASGKRAGLYPSVLAGPVT